MPPLEGRGQHLDFQSPTYRGSCCIHLRPQGRIIGTYLSVPYITGKLLHLPERPVSSPRHRSFSPLHNGEAVASDADRLHPEREWQLSVPYITGTLLHPGSSPPASATAANTFSPLHNGEAVASPDAEQCWSAGGLPFSPLHNGEAVASSIRPSGPIRLGYFQSPT